MLCHQLTSNYLPVHDASLRTVSHRSVPIARAQFSPSALIQTLRLVQELKRSPIYRITILPFPKVQYPHHAQKASYMCGPTLHWACAILVAELEIEDGGTKKLKPKPIINPQ